MERIRAEIAQEALRHRLPDSITVISVSSGSSTASSVALVASTVKNKGHPRIIFDSDEEDSVNEILDLSPHVSPDLPVPQLAPIPGNNVTTSSFRDPQPNDGLLKAKQQFRLKQSDPVIIPIPTNDRPPTSNAVGYETFDIPPGLPYENEVRKSAAEANKDLKELFEGGIDNGLDDINMEDAIVESFKDDIVLKPHQIKGRAWMKERETGKKAGGLLCDDMGLGKTIQTVVRIVDGPPGKEDRRNGWSHTTLVICPLALVKQWAQEIKKYTGGTLRVVEHHGSSRTADPRALGHAHVVVTSYAVVASEYATWRGQTKDESVAKKTQKKATSELDPDNSDSSSSNFGRTLENGRPKNAPAKKLDAMFRVQWWRIVLDEAHNIKNRNTKQALACCALEAKYRWALTGTPIQNNIEDLFSLFKFLRIRPLNDWTHFNETIARPIKAGRTSRAMKRLHVVLKAIMLRRVKDAVDDGTPLITLPPRNVEVVKCEFDEDERAFYDALEKKTSLTMNKFIARGEVMSNYTQILVMLLRLRQACNHPSLVSKDFQHDAAALDPSPVNKERLPDDNDGLADLFQKMNVNSVRHCEVCQQKIDKHNTSNASKRMCESCDHQLAVEARRKSGRVGSGLPPSSAKLRKIIELLNTIDKKSDGTEKTIIFSQFTGMLDIIQHFLGHAGIRHVRYDGKMNPKQREVSLQAIRKEKSTRVILISFKAGGAGLNLTSCNNIILVDLWWNPALEEQAFGRVHRYGQEREVLIYKLTIDQTVEQRILSLQETKHELARAALSGDKLKANKLGEDELLALFRRDIPDLDDED